MTEKDYYKIIDVLIKCNNSLDCDLTDKQFDSICDVFAWELKKDDNLFDLIKFYDIIERKKNGKTS